MSQDEYGLIIYDRGTHISSFDDGRILVTNNPRDFSLKLDDQVAIHYDKLENVLGLATSVNDALTIAKQTNLALQPDIKLGLLNNRLSTNDYPVFLGVRKIVAYLEREPLLKLNSEMRLYTIKP